MYTTGKDAATVVLPATGLSVATQSMALIAVVLIIGGVWVLWRNRRSPHRP